MEQFPLYYTPTGSVVEMGLVVNREQWKALFLE